MNEFLADLYGTRETIGVEDSSDVEKLAEAQILDDVLKSEGIDVDQLDDGTILKLAHEIFGDDSELVKSAAEESEETEEEEAAEESEEESEEEKTAAEAEKADTFGRIMAHSMVQELGNIEKQAAINPDLARGALRHLGTKAGKGLSGGRQLGKVEGKVRELAFKAKPKVEKAKKHLSKHKGKYQAGTAAVAGLPVGMALKKGKKKAASAIDKLAEQRALEILAENGIEVDDSQDKLASAVEQRAWEMLAEAGYVSEE